MKIFQIGSLICFLGAVIHFFLSFRIKLLTDSLFLKQSKNRVLIIIGKILTFLSNVELIFCFWILPLIIVFISTLGVSSTWNYFLSKNYIYPFYIAIFVIFIESKPIISLAERILVKFSKLGSGSPKAWWVALLTITPILSFFLKESGAITIASTLLLKRFYYFQPSKTLSHATLGLLFSNISISGLLFPYASRALSLASLSLGWKVSFFMCHFSWKVILTILLSTLIYYFIFRKELNSLGKNKKAIELSSKSPWWIIFVHITFVITILVLPKTLLTTAGLLILFFAFHKITSNHQDVINFQHFFLIIIFFTSVIVFCDLQEWWVLHIAKNLSNNGILILSILSSISLDHTIINYLISKTFVWLSECSVYLSVIGTMSVGGLTLTSNFPNILGYLILKKAFKKTFSLFLLFSFSIIPSLVSLGIFLFLKNIPKFVSCSF